MRVLTETSRQAHLGGAAQDLVFGEVAIDVTDRRVRTPAGASRLEPKVFDLLLILMERPGLTASCDHLVETVWGQAEGAEGALSRAVVTLRRALGDDERAPRFIETVPDLGYRWIFEEPPGRSPPPPRWALGPVWVAAGAMLAIAVGGVGAGAAYAWVQNGEPEAFEGREIRRQQATEGRCPDQAKVVRERGASSPPNCAPSEPRSFVQR